MIFFVYFRLFRHFSRWYFIHACDEFLLLLYDQELLNV